MEENGVEKARSLSDVESEYHKASVALVSGLLKKEEKAKKEKAARSRLVLDVGLEAAGLNYLEGFFGYKVEAVPRFALVSSAFMEGFAKCMNKRVMDCKTWEGEEVVIPEGDLKQIVVRMAEWMHVCRFYARPSDHSRYADEDRFIQRTCGSKNGSMGHSAEEVTVQLRQGGGRNICVKGYECNHPADTIVIQPAYFQPGAQSVAMLMEKHNAVRGKGWFFFVPEMLVLENGTLLDGRVRYHVDRSRGVVAVFDKSSQVPFYVYKIMDMLSIIQNRVFMYNGASYCIELTGDDQDVLQYIVVRGDDSLIAEESTYVPLWLSRNTVSADSVVMSFLTHIPGRPELGPQRVAVRTRRSLVEKVVSRLMAKTDMSASLKDARQAVHDLSDQYMELGAFVALPHAIDGIVSEYIARGAYRRARFAKLEAILVASVLDGAFRRVQANLRGSYLTGLLVLMNRTGALLASVVREPMEVILEAANSDSWDVTIVDDDPLVLLKKDWDPTVRGESKLGSVQYDMFKSSVRMPNPIVKQAWEWAKTHRASVGVERDFEKERVIPTMKLGDDRENLIDKLVVAYDATSVKRSGERSTEFETVGKPTLTPSVAAEDPFTVMQEEFDENFPGVAMVDYAVRPYLAVVSDREYSNVAAAFKARASEQPPRDMKIRPTVLNCGVSGPRPRMAFETGVAFGKRVGGAPDYQHPRVLDKAVRDTFDKFQRAVFKPGWRDVVRDRVARGLWQPRESSIRDVVSKMKPSVVSKASSENFNMVSIIMNEFEAMVKAQPKDKLDVATAFEHTASQTIMYQPSKSTNAFFSSMLGEVHDLLDDILIPGVIINPRRDKAYAEHIWNATSARRKSAAVLQKIDVDIGQCDKSQCAFNLMCYLYTLEQLGMPEDIRMYLYEIVDKKVASSRETGMRIWFFYQVVSGLFATISINSLNVGMATVESFDIKPWEMVNMLVSGDDVLLVLNKEKSLQLAADVYASVFNFEVKVFEPKALYWCGRYLVDVEDYTYFVKDPERLFSALARYQLEGHDSAEAYQSFLDETEAYDWEELVVGVARCVQLRNDRRVAPVGTCRAVATLRRSASLYESRFLETRVLSM